MKILVYIGLPKTATTFLQTQVFPQMGESILYNPDQLTFPIMQLLRKQRLLTETEVANHRMMVDRISRENFGKTLVIVNEHLGYTSMNPDPEFGAKRLKQLFPEAHVVACLRYQTDWLLSYYRHFIDIGGYKNVKVFLGWNGTEFCHDCGYDNFIGNFRISSLDGCIDIYKLGWADYVSCFHQQYAKSMSQSCGLNF